MITEVVTTAYGPPAHVALAKAVDRAKGGDPLDPVTVVVPVNTVGLAARRYLGRYGTDVHARADDSSEVADHSPMAGQSLTANHPPMAGRSLTADHSPGGGRRGIAGVRFLTTYGLAELLGASRVADSGRQPVTTSAVAAAVRAILRTQPGHFAGVATHPATERSLVQAHRELSELGSVGLDRLAATSRRAAEVVRIHRSVRSVLDGQFSNEQSLVDAAVKALDNGEFPPGELGHLVVFLPQALTSSQSRLLVAVANQIDSTIIAAMTGVTEADEAVRAAVTQLGATPGHVESPKPDPERVHILSVSDPDEEVRHAVRALVEASRRGVALSRCAILHGNAEPYARLVGDALDRAGISWSGATVETAATSLLGRSLLAMLSLPDHDYSRREVMAWLTSCPVLYTTNGADLTDDPAHTVAPKLPNDLSPAPGSTGSADLEQPPSQPSSPKQSHRTHGRVRRGPVPSAAWERVARGAGVIGGIEHWRHRLLRYAHNQRAAADDLADDDVSEARLGWMRREATSAGELAEFVHGLAQDLEANEHASSWASLAAWCKQLVNTYFGDAQWRQGTADGHRCWPAHERRFAELVEETIDQLGHLDSIDDQPSLPSFRRALQTELEGASIRRGRFGQGVLTGAPHAALAVELDLAVVCGLAEGVFPVRRHEDPLLRDQERLAAGHDLPLHADRTNNDHRALLAVMAAAQETLLIYPRGDLRKAAERVPSRWLLDTIEAQTRVRPSTEELAHSGSRNLGEVPSFVAGLRQMTFPAHVQEYDMRTLLDWHDQKKPISEHPLLGRHVELRRGVTLTLARRSDRFTRFDGNLYSDGDLRGIKLPHPCDAGQITSASRLEAWAKCPHAYFVRHVLRVEATDDPDESHRTTPLERGNLVHRILDRWLNEAITANNVPAPDQGWPSQYRHRLLEIAAEECDQLETLGNVGSPLYWERDRSQILEELERALVMDNDKRRSHSSTPIASELGFAMFGREAGVARKRSEPVLIELGEPELSEPGPGKPELTGGELSKREPGKPELTGGELSKPGPGKPELTGGELSEPGPGKPELTGGELSEPELIDPELSGHALSRRELSGRELSEPLQSASHSDNRVTGAPRNGRRLALRGSIDRVDETATGGLVVIDYKTGTLRDRKEITSENPTPLGGNLQLVLYALAARKIFGRPDAETVGEYWFVSQRGGFESLGYLVDNTVKAKVLETVGVISDGIGAGLFPMHPDKPGWDMWIPCRYCEPDGLGRRDIWRDWLRKRTRPDLRNYTALVDPEALETSESDDGSGQ